VGGFELGPDHEAPEGALAKLAVAVRRGLAVSRLGARPVDRARLALGTLWLLGRAQTRARGNDRLVVSIRAYGRVGSAVLSDYSHIRLLELIFLEGHYAVDPLRPDPEVVVDLGSNVGLSILFFRLRFPGARIFGVEPDPAAFGLLERNVARYGGDITVVQAAVGDREGTATFWSAPGAVASSLFKTHEAQAPVEVPVRTLAALLADAGIAHVDVLKLVVEGSEFEALRSVSLDTVDTLAGEIALTPGGDRSEAAFRALLADYDLELTAEHGSVFRQFKARRRR
jgi:FkbM family methyltransferase